MATFPNSGRIALAESIANETLHLAWGTGDGSWTTPPTEDANATALLNEVGRRTVSAVSYVTPSDTGEIVLPDGGKFTASVSHTRHLLLTINFDYPDASSSVIRELAVFIGTQVAAGLPIGQQYFTPGQVTNPGRMLHLENIAPLYRSPAIAQSFQIVITL